MFYLTVFAEHTHWLKIHNEGGDFVARLREMVTLNSMVYGAILCVCSHVSSIPVSYHARYALCGICPPAYLYPSYTNLL